MNLFATSACPRLSAQALDDARVVKMATETAQLLSTAVRIVAPDALPDGSLYMMSHAGHPVARWVRRSREAFQWTLQHGLALLDEYAERFPDGGVHAASRVVHPVLGVHLHAVLPLLPSDPAERMVNHAANLGMGLDFRDVEDPFLAYRAYLTARWQIARPSGRVRFTRREPPAWALPYLSPAEPAPC